MAIRRIFVAVLCLLFSAITLSAAQPQDVLWGLPYLQNMTTDGVTVMYQSRGSVHSWVEVGIDSMHTQRFRQLRGGQEVVHDQEHRVRLSGLQPGQTYYYRICAQEITKNQSYHKTFGCSIATPFYRFTLPADTMMNFTAIILNDLHGVQAVINRVAACVDSIQPDLIFFNGDCLSEPADRDQAIRMVQSLVVPFHGEQRPLVFIRGNHEIRNAYSSGMTSLMEWPGGETYHAFSWGRTRFVVLDCGEDKPDSTWVYYGLNDFSGFRQDQVGFLQQEIRSRAFRKADHRFLLHHIPLWFDNEANDPGGASAPCRTLWADLLTRAGIDCAFNGHTHRQQFYDKGQQGNPYPMYIGGGPAVGHASVYVLRVRGKEYSVETILR